MDLKNNCYNKLLPKKKQVIDFTPTKTRAMNTPNRFEYHTRRVKIHQRIHQ